MNNATLASTIRSDYAGLVALFTRKLRDTALAEDLIHDAFVESLDKLQHNRIADPSRFSGFVYAVALNLWRNHRRRMDNRVAAQGTEDILATLPCESSPFEELHRDALAHHVMDAIEELPVARDRDVIRLFYLDEADKADVCRRFGIEGSHLDKILFRARRRMRPLMLARGLTPRDASRDADSRP